MTLKVSRGSHFFVIISCQTVQQTGRSQLGEDVYQETLRKNRLWARSDWQAELHRVGQRIPAGK